MSMISNTRLLSPISCIQNVEAYICKAPIEVPITTSIGTMFDRTTILVKIEDSEGNFGWGEVWCNFPSFGAYHRARLITEVLAPILTQQSDLHPSDIFHALTKKTHLLDIQCGEPGPLSQAIAGIDIALWDLLARKNDLPLSKALNAEASNSVPAYASGIQINKGLDNIDYCRQKGFRAFKFKVGSDPVADSKVVNNVSQNVSEQETLMLDANQSWSFFQAAQFIKNVSESHLQWLEEPIDADRPVKEWADLASLSSLPIAAGENIRGHARFSEIVKSGHIKVIQPDACKWGGITGCLSVAKEAIKYGRMYCPHSFGGGIGLIASAHILAASGGDGLLEVDVTPNPLRESLIEPFPAVNQGFFTIPLGPGLGCEPEMDVVKKYNVQVLEYQRR